MSPLTIACTLTCSSYIPAMDDKDWTNNYPIAQKYKDIFEDIVPRWQAMPLLAFDTDGHYIKTHELEAVLMGLLSTLPCPRHSTWIQVESEWNPGGMVGMVGIW